MVVWILLRVLLFLVLVLILLKQTRSVYPNPTKDVLTIEVENFNAYPLQVFDVNGALVEELTLQSRQEVIDVSHLPNGVYHIRFGTNAQKLVITQ